MQCLTLGSGRSVEGSVNYVGMKTTSDLVGDVARSVSTADEIYMKV